MKIIEAYQCDDCTMTSAHKSSVARHELNTCRKNKARKTCLQCKHWFDRGEDDNGMPEPYKETWQEAGCEKDNPTDYFFRNSNTDCKDFEPNP